MALCMASANARAQAVTRATSDEQSRSWKRWLSFIKSIDLQDDPFLRKFNRQHRILLMSAFAHSVRTAEYSKRRISQVAEGTVRSTVDHVSQTYRNHQFEDPRLDANNKPSLLLQRQYAGYKSQDPPPQHQKALPALILIQLLKNRTTERSIAIAQLCIGAFFFAMRSCEYLSVSGPARKTKRLRIRNLRFFRNKKRLKSNDPTISLADYVTITFEDQKNDQKNDSITHHRSDDKTLCPVRMWASIVKRILSYKNTNIDTHVNAVQLNNKLHFITGTEVKLALRAAATVVGETKLGFKPTDIGTHSLRSGAAMAMYLSNIPVYTIMLLGRWSSDAFLLYIRKQVQEFSQNVSKRMIRHTDFAHVPDFDPTVTTDDPRVRNHRHNAQTRLNMGQATVQVHPTMPSFSLFT